MSAVSAVPAPAVGDIDRIHEQQQRNRATVAAATVAQRIEKLRRFHDALLAARGEVRAAMWADFRKPPEEVDLSELYAVVGEARHAMRRLRRWTKPKRVGSTLALAGSRNWVHYEPKGVVLVIGPWNFPFNLTLSAVVSAIAAGNCVIVKPSELTPASSACMKRIVGSVFDENEVAVIEGDAKTAEALLRKRFDHIFFIGSPAVGKLVMKAAAENLTSVTLELGGKSPVLVDRSANLDQAARRLAWGKFYNAGQACVAPDYLLLDESIRDVFLEKLVAAVHALGGPASRSIIVNDRHAARVRRLIDDAVARGAEPVLGGTGVGREIDPTILTNVSEDAAILQEEIFGPILPIVTYRTLDEAMRIIEEREKPLVLYIFTRDRSFAKKVIARTRAGGTMVNHTLLHFFQLELPFGGVGHSGFGKSHGYHGFEAFSNARAVFEQAAPFATMDLLFPPYGSKLKQKLIDLTLRWF